MQKHFSAEVAAKSSKNVQSQIRLVVLIGLCVFFGEAFVMVVIALMRPFPTWITAFFDASMLTIESRYYHAKNIKSVY